MKPCSSSSAEDLGLAPSEVEAQAGPAPASSPEEIRGNRQELGAHSLGGAIAAMLPGTWAAGQMPAVRISCLKLCTEALPLGWSPPALGAGLGQQRYVGVGREAPRPQKPG